jgi:hypothetical protein
MSPIESKTWAPLHLWANPDIYEPNTMTLSIEPASDVPPPADRTYTLELLYVPDGVQGAPPVGTTWSVPPDQIFMIDVPTFMTYDGLEGYRFAFKIWPAECPADITGPDALPDGLTGIADLALLLGSYGLCDGESGFVPEADLTGGPAGEPDGCVNLADLAFLLGDYGCSTSP